MSLIRTTISFFLFLLLILVGCEQANDPYSLFEEGNYQSAFRGFASLANQGDLQAQNHLGVMYYLGLGRKRNVTLAKQWFEKAAVKGLPGAQFNLANMYENGEGVEKDFVTSYMWFYAADKQGHKRAEERMILLLDDHKLFPNQALLAVERANSFIFNTRKN